MSKTMLIESDNRTADISAATQIIFEMESGKTNKIVWQSNITKIVDAIYVGLDETLVRMETMQMQMLANLQNTKNITDSVFQLTDAIEKLDAKLRKNNFKIGDIEKLFEECHANSVDNRNESDTSIKTTSKQPKKAVKTRCRRIRRVDKEVWPD
jgi:hypothetical protein